MMTAAAPAYAKFYMVRQMLAAPPYHVSPSTIRSGEYMMILVHPWKHMKYLPHWKTQETGKKNGITFQLLLAD
eukprot:4912006-Ditylum_brightwellii.AAC.2